MDENGIDVTLDVMLVAIAAVAAVLWNIGVINSAMSSGISDPVMQIFLLLIFAIVLAEVYVVNTDRMKVKLRRAFERKDVDFYEKAAAQRRRESRD